MKPLLLLVIFFLSFPLMAQPTYGPGENQLGRFQGSGDDWLPLFFSLDDRGHIHVPDFYKGRIAIFSPKGELLRQVRPQAGLSPGMNYFGRGPLGHYVMIDQYTLFFLGETGQLIASHPLGSFDGVATLTQGVTVRRGDSQLWWSWNALDQKAQELVWDKPGAIPNILLSLEAERMGWQIPIPEVNRYVLVQKDSKGHTYWARSAQDISFLELDPQGLVVFQEEYVKVGRPFFTIFCSPDGRWATATVYNDSMLLFVW